MIGAVIYARYSSEKQNEQSIEGQLRVCNQYAEQNGLTVLDTYIDRAMTGTNDNRPAFQQMLADCEKAVAWDVILVYAIDRFGRNSIEIAVNKQRIKKNHKTLISATQRTSENIDGSKNLDGILLENVYIGLAEYYSAELSQKVKRGMNENREKGLNPGGRRAFGYRAENKKIYVDESEAEIVRYIFQQYAQGVNAKDILADITAKGVTHYGKPIPLNTLYNMLRLKKYIGIYHCANKDYTNIFPPIVPVELFNEVGRILESNKKGSKSNDVEFLLKGKLLCGHCGKSMQGDSGTSKSGKVMYYYKCMGRKKYRNCNKSTIQKDKLEQIVIDTTKQIFSVKENVIAVADAVIQSHEKRMYDRSLLTILQNEREEIKKSLSNIMKAIEQGIITATTKSRMDELEQQLADTENKITIEECKLQNQLRREQVIEYLTHAVIQSPRLIIHNLIQKIVVYDDRINIYYNYLNRMPSPDNPPDNGEYLAESGHNNTLTKGCSDFSLVVSPSKTQVEFYLRFSIPGKIRHASGLVKQSAITIH